MSTEQRDLSKLPRWARDRITTLERQRETAIQALNEYLDDQTPSRFYMDDILSTGENVGPTFKRRYIQGRQIWAEHAGIYFHVHLRDSDEIELQWGGLPVHSSTEVAMIPSTHQRVRLVSKEKMR